MGAVVALAAALALSARTTARRPAMDAGRPDRMRALAIALALNVIGVPGVAVGVGPNTRAASAAAVAGLRPPCSTRIWATSAR